MVTGTHKHGTDGLSVSEPVWHIWLMRFDGQLCKTLVLERGTFLMMGGGGRLDFTVTRLWFFGGGGGIGGRLVGFKLQSVEYH